MPSDNPKNQLNRRNKNYEWDEAEQRLKQWRMRAQRNQTYQYASSRHQERLHYALGIPTIGLTALVATLGFISINESANAWISALIAGFGSLATVLSAINTFVNYGSRSDAHQRGGVRFGNIARDIEATLATPRAKRGPVEYVLSRFAEKMSSAASEAPIMEEKIMENID